MGNNIAILTNAAEAVTETNINDIGADVFAHTTQDYAQHTQVQIYPVAYAIGSSTVSSVNINVAIYRNHSSAKKIDASGDKVNYFVFTNFYGSLTSTDVMFYQNNNGRWYPFGLTHNFSADITGLISAPTAGNYAFTMGSDDGTYLFIDGTQVIANNGGEHAYRRRTGDIFLTSGNHTFEIMFFQGPGLSGVDLFLPAGVVYPTQTITRQNIVSTQTLFLGLTFNGSNVGFALPVNSTGTLTFQNSPPIIVTQPASTVDAGIGDITQFQVAVISDLPVTYQWQRNAPVGTAGQQTLQQQAQGVQTDMNALPLSGYTAPQSTNKTRASQIMQRLVSELPNKQTVAPPFRAVTDAQALVPLIADPTVSQEIQTLIVAIQTSIAEATGAGTPFNNIPGQTNSTLTLVNLQSTDAALYRVICQNANGTTISSDGTLIVNAFKAAKKKKG